MMECGEGWGYLFLCQHGNHKPMIIPWQSVSGKTGWSSR